VTRRPVRISADAEAQLIAIRSWWLVNRAAAPDLFDRELDAAVVVIGKAPGAFPVYRREGDDDVRRALLPKSRYAVYFSVEANHVLVVALWHTARGSGPPLP
jgi:plasmid stabilization system protein ParE